MAEKGGKRQGAGRKPKEAEQRIRDIVSPYVDGAIESVVNILQTADKDADRIAAAKLLLSYAWGTPKQQLDHTTNGESLNDQPIVIKFGNNKSE